jgi:hypothetical protein
LQQLHTDVTRLTSLTYDEAPATTPAGCAALIARGYTGRATAAQQLTVR